MDFTIRAIFEKEKSSKISSRTYNHAVIINQQIKLVMELFLKIFLFQILLVYCIAASRDPDTCCCHCACTPQLDSKNVSVIIPCSETKNCSSICFQKHPCYFYKTSYQCAYYCDANYCGPFNGLNATMIEHCNRWEKGGHYICQNSYDCVYMSYPVISVGIGSQCDS